MLPPHLPPPTCNVHEHRKIQRLKILLVATFFGLLAGVSGAAVMLGWIWPTVDDNDWWAVSRARSGLSRGQLEARAQTEASERIVTVFSATDVVGAVPTLAREHRLGSAVVVGSDGWLAMRLPGYSGWSRAWRVLAADGRVHTLEKVIYDSRSEVAYLKIFTDKDSSQQFKVVSFADDLKAGDEVFLSSGGSWQYGWVDYTGAGRAATAHLDAAPARFSYLNRVFSEGAIAVNNQGRFCGIAMADGRLLTVSAIARVLPGVLSEQKITYYTLGAEGWYSSESAPLIDGEKVEGFLVVKTVAKKTALRRGDIVLEINGQIATPDTLWYNIEGKESARLKVWRSGEILEIDAPVSRI